MSRARWYVATLFLFGSSVCGRAAWAQDTSSKPPEQLPADTTKQLADTTKQLAETAKQLEDKAAAMEKLKAEAQLNRFRLMSLGIAPGVGLAVQIPVAFMEDRRQSEAALGGMTYVSLHPFYWSRRRPILNLFCANTWVGASNAEVNDAADAEAATIAGQRMKDIASRMEVIIREARKLTAPDKCGGYDCSGILAKDGEDLWPRNDSSAWYTIHQVCDRDKTTTDPVEDAVKTCYTNQIRITTQKQLWRPGIPGRCGAAIPGFYFGVSLPYSAQILSPQGSLQRSINAGVSGGLSLSLSAYLSILLGVTYTTYDESSDANNKQRHNQLTATFAMGGNIDILTKLLTK